jgi:signal transduction histidine kinase
VVKSQFVSVVSHELRTPLTSIKGSLDLINSGQIGPVHPQVSPLLDMASKNSRRLAHLIDDLLDLQKIEAGEMSFKLDALDVGKRWWSKRSSRIRALPKSTRSRSAQIVPEGVRLTVNADESRLMQVLSNMISNACEVFVRWRTRWSSGASVVGDMVRLFVRDHGAGIPPGAREKVFGRFSQLDSSDQRRTGEPGSA